MELLFATKAIVEHIKSPIIHPTLPETRGYKNCFLAPHFAMQVAENSWDWFVMWMGLLSYAVALAETTQALQPGCAPKDAFEWKTLIKNAGLSKLWLEAIPLNANIYDYSYNAKRSGVILVFPPQTTDQPSPMWLNSHGIPFWYRLGKEEETCLKSTGLFDVITPLPYQINKLSTRYLNNHLIHLSRNFCYTNTYNKQTPQTQMSHQLLNFNPLHRTKA